MSEFGWGEYPNLKSMAASLETACTTILELTLRIETLELQLNNMTTEKAPPTGAFLPRNRRTS